MPSICFKALMLCLNIALFKSHTVWGLAKKRISEH